MISPWRLKTKMTASFEIDRDDDCPNAFHQASFQAKD